jgi:hypothetical protein
MNAQLSKKSLNYMLKTGESAVSYTSIKLFT